MTTRAEQLDREILDALVEGTLSPSHDRWHTDRVLGFAEQLQRSYGGDPEVLVAAARLHDLGRDDPRKHGPASAKESVRQSKSVLSRTSIESDKIPVVLEAIEQHDQPGVRPASLEGRILKDADFLAGFGAWGILRVCMWAGEAGQGVPQVLERLRDRMSARIRGLEFPESRDYAYTQMLLVRHFLSCLEDNPIVPSRREGAYVIFEGISGSGKDTQINALEARLRQEGIQAAVAREPTDYYRSLREVYRWMLHGMESKEGLTVPEQLFLLLTTRHRLVTTEIIPALQEGRVVLANRSFLSATVYQECDEFDSAFIALLHHFVPAPDLVFVLDLEPKQAYQRLCESRGEEDLSVHEKLRTMERHRPLYRDHAEKVFGSQRVLIVNAGDSIPIVSSKVFESVRRVLEERNMM